MYFSSRQWGEQLEVRKQSEQKTINPQDVTCFKCQQKPTTLLKSFSPRNIRTCPKFQRAGSAKVARPVNHVHMLVSIFFVCTLTNISKLIKIIIIESCSVAFSTWLQKRGTVSWYNMYFTLLLTQKLGIIQTQSAVVNYIFGLNARDHDQRLDLLQKYTMS